MQLEGEGYLSKLKDFPSVESIGKLKDIADGVEIKLRWGSIISDSRGEVKGGLAAWDVGKTTDQTVNVLGETALGTRTLGEAITEWKKGTTFAVFGVW